MNVLEATRIAFTSLLANKLRAVLTMLGIIIGVGAVIALMALGGAVQTLITGELNRLGTNLIFLFAGTNDQEANRRTPPRLTNEDLAAIADPLNVPAVAAVAPQFSRRGNITHQGVGKQMDVVLVFDPKGKFVRSFGKAFHGGGHGVEIRKEGSDEFCYLSNSFIGKNELKVMKTDLKGKVVWQ
nr:ABC transporter permease [Chloroflexaceae bacterium]